MNSLAQRPPGSQPALGISISFTHAFIEQVLVEYYVFQVLAKARRERVHEVGGSGR